MKIRPVMRTDEHHVEKHRKYLERKDKQDIRLLFIGDSLVRRWEDNRELWNGFFAEYGAANFGVGADRPGDIARQPDRLRQAEALGENVLRLAQRTPRA